MIKYTTISTDEELINLRKNWFNKNIHVIAMDFEGEYNLHAYGCKLCLIQVFDRFDFYIIDPFELSKIELKKTLEDENLVKIFYGAGSDINLVYKQYGIKMNSVWDLKTFVDTLEYEKKEFYDIINDVLGIKIENKKKFQMHNWIKRPIDKDAIQYALTDVQYLFLLKEKLLNMVIREGKTETLIKRLIKSRIDYDKESIPTIFKSKEFKILTPEERELAKKIYNIRECYAKQINCPPNLLLDKVNLINVTKNIDSIERIKPNKKINEELWSRFKSEILQLKK